jgi:hypothetical protein
MESDASAIRIYQKIDDYEDAALRRLAEQR